METIKDKKVRECSETDAVVALAAVIAKSYQLKGLYFRDDYPLEEVAYDTFNIIKGRHPNAMFGEVLKGISRGVSGDFGDVTMLPPMTMANFVRDHLKVENVVNYQTNDEDHSKLLELDERFEMVKHVVFMYECVLEDKPIYAANWSKVFGFLKNTGTLVDYSNERDQIIEDAISKLIEKWQNARNGHNGAEVKRNIEEIKEQGGMHRDIQEMCKRDAVQKTLETWKIGLLDKDVLRDELDKKSKEVYL